MKISLRQLQVFVAIASHGQVTRAAQTLALSQAAASMALADLENQLGTPLIHRSGKRWQLSDSGRSILPLAREVLDRVADIEAIGTTCGTAFDLHVGASVTIGNHLLPELLARLAGDYPQARLLIARHNTEQVVTRLLNFQIDIGFIEGPPLADSRLICQPWRADELQLCAAPSHPLAGKTASIAELKAARWVTRERGSGTRDCFERACANAGVRPDIVLELEQPEAVRQCVRLGLGLGCLSGLELREAFKAGWLQPVMAPALDLRRQLCIALHAQKHRTLGIRTLLALCGVAPDA